MKISKLLFFAGVFLFVFILSFFVLSEFDIDVGEGNVLFNNPILNFLIEKSLESSINTNVTYENNFSHLNVSEGTLVLYMPFDIVEDENNLTYDYTNNSNDGELSNTPLFNSSGGVYGGAYDFNGVNNYIDTTVPSDSLGGNFTFSLWINPDEIADTDSGAYRIISRGTSSCATRASLAIDNSLVGLIAEGGAFVSGTSVNIGDWYHVVGIWTSAGWEFWVNGTQIGSGGDLVSGADSTTITVGAQHCKDRRFYNGTIDEVMIFNRSLSQTEIQQIYNSTYERFYPQGEMLFENNNFGTNNTLNVSLADCQELNGSSIQVKVNDGTYQDLDGNCEYNAYSISGSTSSANVTFKLDSNENSFYSPSVIGNVSLTTTLAQEEFTSTWNTSKTSTGSSNSTSVSLPLVSSGNYDFTVDWGDGNTTTVTEWNSSNATHDYKNEGNYNITITGTIEGFAFQNSGDRDKILDITNWGPLNLGNTGGYFYGASNFNITATDDLNLTGTTDMSNAFRSANSFNGNITNWDVSEVVNMSRMFAQADSFNKDLVLWDTSSVTDMSSMFAGSGSSSFNGNISTWNTSSVTDMSSMFDLATNFNQDIGNWDVSSVTDMGSMLKDAHSFNQDITQWNTSSVTDMSYMFRMTFTGLSSFNQDISSWDTSSVTDMNHMFTRLDSFNQDIGNWDVSSVTDMSNMFDSATLSTSNYDSLLIGWSDLNLQSDVTFDGGNSEYCEGGSARNDTLIGVYNWSITDGGENSSCSPNPTYSNNNANNTIISQSTNFSLEVSDDTALNPKGQYIFSTNNSGVWVNDSAVNFTSTPETISTVKTLNDTSGISIGYRWYLTDNAGNSNDTGVFSLTTTDSSQQNITVESITESSFPVSSATHNVSMPATANIGDLLVILYMGDNSATPSGWTELGSSSRFAAHLTVLYKVADGNEGGTNVTVTMNNPQEASAQVYRITGHNSSIEISTVVSNGSNSPNSSSLTPSWGADDTLWITAFGAADDDATVSSYPTDYTNGVDTVSGGGAGNGATVGSARRELNATSEDPGAFTLSQTQSWVAFTIAIEPSQEEANDTTPPTFTTIPANDTITYGTDWSGVDFDATDETSFDSYAVNDSRFTINSTGFLDDVSTLGVGSYEILITINDSSGNENSTEYLLTVNQATPSLTLQVTNSTYPNNGIINASESNSGDGDVTYNIYIDGTLETSGSDIDLSKDLGAGNYTIVYNTTGGTNYTSASETLTLEVSKGILQGSLSGTSPITYGTAGDVEGTESNSGDGDVTYNLYRNGTLVSNPDTTTLSAGTYGYVYNSTGGNNWTSNSSIDTFDLTVNQATPTLNLDANNVTYPNNLTILANETNSGDGDLTYNLYIDGTLQESGSTINSNFDLAVGTYTIVYNTTGGTNYTSASETIEREVLINDEVVYVLFNETSPITYPESFRVYSNTTSDFTILRNGTTINNNSEQSLSAGTWNFTVVRTDQTNYSDVYSEELFTINKATTNLAVSGTSPITYGTAGDVEGTGCPSQLTCNLYRNETLVSNPDTSVLSAGTYNYVYNTTGNENYTSDSDSFNLTVNKASGAVELFLDGSQSNRNVNVGDNVSIVGNLTAGTFGTLNLTIDDSEVNSSSSENLTYIYETNNTGTFVVNLSYDGNENYTSDSESWNISVSDPDVPTVNIIYPVSGNDYSITSFDLNYSASDDTGDSCWYSTDGGSSNSSAVSFGTNFTGVSGSEGSNTWTVYCNDTSSNEGSGSVTFDIDTTEPYFTTIPADDTITYPNDWAGVDFDATDDGVGLDSYSVNDSRFTINSTGYLDNASSLSAGNYSLNVSINDTLGHENYSVYSLEVSKANPDAELTNSTPLTMTYPTEITLGLSESNSGDGDVTYEIFRDGSSIGTGETVTLGVGSYDYVLNTTGGTNYTANSSLDNFTAVVNQNTESCNVLFNETSPITYPENFAVYSDCSSNFTLYRNGSTITNNSLQDLAAGTWNFTVIRDDDVNYSNSYDEELFVVNKANGSGTLYIDHISDNKSVEVNNNVELNATLDNGTGNINLYVNDTLYESGSSPLYNISNYTVVGLYEIKLNYSGNENYTSFEETLYLNITSDDLVNPLIDFANGVESNNSFVSRDWIFVNVSVTETNEDTITFDLYNSSLFNSSSFTDSSREINFTSLSEGVYYYNVTVNDTSGNSNSTETREITLDVTNPEVTISSPANGTTYTSTPISFDIRTNEDSTCEYSFDSGSSNSSLSANSTGTGHTASLSLSNADYDTNIYCTDLAGNLNGSESVSFTVSVSSGGGSGGSSGGGGGTSSSSTDYSLDVSNLNLDVGVLTTKVSNISVTNNGQETLNLSIGQSDLDGRVVLPGDYIEIAPDETKNLQFIFEGLDQVGVYNGTLLLGDKKVPVSLNVVVLDLLFDSNIVVLNKNYIVRQGEKLKTSIELIPQGDEARLDITLDFVIKDYQDNVYLTKSESILIEDRMQVEREFDTGILPVGNYVIEVELTYPNGVAPSSAHFEVIEFVPTTLFGKIVFYLVNSVLIVLALIIGIIIKNLIQNMRSGKNNSDNILGESKSSKKV